MIKYIFIFSVFTFLNLNFIQAQEYSKQELDSIKREIFTIKNDVNQIQLQLADAKKTLKTGIFVATLGYTVTIIGGQLLGTNPELGEALLYTGGAIGIGGTIVLVNGFNKIGLSKPKIRTD
jgi:glycogen synthase